MHVTQLIISGGVPVVVFGSGIFSWNCGRSGPGGEASRSMENAPHKMLHVEKT